MVGVSIGQKTNGRWKKEKMMSEIIVRMKSDHIKVKDGEYVQDLIRCKECKWSKANGIYQWCGRLDSTAKITADDYCSYGEKE